MTVWCCSLLPFCEMVQELGMSLFTMISLHVCIWGQGEREGKRERERRGGKREERETMYAHILTLHTNKERIYNIYVLPSVYSQ